MVKNMKSIGAAVRDPGSTRRNKTGSWRTFKPVADKENVQDAESVIYTAQTDAYPQNMIQTTITVKDAESVQKNVQ